MTTTYDVIVIGAGAVGAACGWELAGVGKKVLICDRGRVPGEAWRAAAGMLAPQIEAGVDDPLFELGIAGRERYAEIASKLQAETGIDIGFWQEGTARIALEEGEVPELKSRVAWQRQHGHVCDWFDAGEVRSRWPWLGPTAGALWAPREAALHPERLVAAFREGARRRGANIVSDTVTRVDRRGPRVTGVSSGSQKYSADHVVVAAGAWSGQVAGIPRPISVEPIRGQMAAMPWPSDTPPAIVVAKSGYILARDGEAVLGSTREHAGFDAEVTSAGLASIFTTASALCPALAAGEVLRAWSGLRPTTPDGLPIVGREPRAEGLWYATGHGRNGILLAAITATIICRLIQGENEVEHLEAMRPERFWEY